MPNKLDTFSSYSIGRIIEYAADAIAEHKKDKSDFNNGKLMAYYEVIHSIKDNMEIADISIDDSDVDINFDEKILEEMGNN